MQSILNFKPAQYYPGKDARVEFYYMEGDRYIRKRIRVNHVADTKQQRQYALTMVKTINDKLYAGWTPALDNADARSLRKALDFFQGNFLPEREDSIRTYKSMIHIFADWCEKRKLLHQNCHLITKKVVLEFLAEMTMAKQLSPRTYNNYLRILKTVFNRLVEHQYIKENPFTGIRAKRPKEKNRKVIPTPVLTKIKEYMAKEYPELILPMKLIYYCGIRPTELSRLRVENILLQKGLIYIHADQAKDHEDAPISLPIHIIHDLAAHLGDASPEEYLFSGNGMKPGRYKFNTRIMANKWNFMREALKLDKSYQLYSLKDSGALALAKNVDSPIELKDQFRHSSLDTTSIYIRKAKPVANVNIMNMKEEW
jgi:integrase